MRTSFVIASLIVIGVLAGINPAHAATETFDSGQDGWQAGTLNTGLEYHATGGNPGGYLLFYGSRQTKLISRSAPFADDYATAGYKSIAVDLYVSLYPIAAPKPGIFVRANPSVAGWSYPLTTFVPQAGIWQHFSVPINPDWSDAEATAAGWRMGDGPAISFADTMRHVWNVGMELDYVAVTAAYIGVDNFTLSQEPAEPASAHPSEPSSSGGNQGSESTPSSGNAQTGSSNSQTGSSSKSPTVTRPATIRPQIRSREHIRRNPKRLPFRQPIPQSSQ